MAQEEAPEREIEQLLLVRHLEVEIVGHVKELRDPLAGGLPIDRPQQLLLGLFGHKQAHLWEAEVDALEIVGRVDDLDAPDILGVVFLSLQPKGLEVRIGAHLLEVHQVVQQDEEREPRLEQLLHGLFLIACISLYLLLAGRERAGENHLIREG